MEVWSGVEVIESGGLFSHGSVGGNTQKTTLVSALTPV